MKERLKEAQKLGDQALEYRKAAGVAEAAGDPLHVVADFNANADYCEAAQHEMMSSVPACQIESGEVIPTAAERSDANGGYAVRDTLATPDAAAIAASLERSELLTQTYCDALALGIDAAQSIQGANSLEKMLAHQMALVHKTSFRLVDEAMQQREPAEMARLINASARMMNVYQSALLALNRLRTGGKQTVTVQHVQVNGGQALVTGNLQTGGRPSQTTGNAEKK